MKNKEPKPLKIVYIWKIYAEKYWRQKVKKCFPEIMNAEAKVEMELNYRAVLKSG